MEWKHACQGTVEDVVAKERLSSKGVAAASQGQNNDQTSGSLAGLTATCTYKHNNMQPCILRLIRVEWLDREL